MYCTYLIRNTTTTFSICLVLLNTQLYDEQSVISPTRKETRSISSGSHPLEDGKARNGHGKHEYCQLQKMPGMGNPNWVDMTLAQVSLS
jgi:hypothetical protein